MKKIKTVFEKHNPAKSGFTLIELMVVIAIVGILVAMAFVNTGKNDDRDVKIEKDRLITYLRELQNRALAADKAGVNLGSDEKLCGFGIYGAVADADSLNAYYINTKTIQATGTSGLDQDCAGLASTDSTGSLYDNPFHLGNDVKLDLSKNIFFLIPQGNVYFGGSNSPSDFPVTIYLKKSGVTDTVQINQLGRIY